MDIMQMEMNEDLVILLERLAQFKTFERLEKTTCLTNNSSPNSTSGL